MRRRIVLVSGAPGVGKTTLAAPLAERLGLPLFSKDFIKETLTDALGEGGGDLLASRRLGGAAMELLWSLAARAPAAVLEANFRPHSDYERGRLAALEAHVVEIWCVCSEREAERRFAARAAGAEHHAAHPLRTRPAEWRLEYDRPVGHGTVIEVSTDRPVAIDGLAAEVGRVWEA